MSKASPHSQSPRAARPDKKALLGSGMKSLGLGQPLRVGNSVPGFDNQNPAAAPEMGATAKIADSAVLPQVMPETSIIEKTGSDFNPVIARPGQPVTPLGWSDAQNIPANRGHETTGSPDDPFSGSMRDPVTEKPGQMETESSVDRVISRPGQAVTPSPRSQPANETLDEKRRLPVITRAGTLRPKDHFCAIPNAVLSKAGLFENAFDFMTYLYFFSKSYGFGRNTCDMGVNELMTFTGLAKNSVRKSIERLTAQKWIRMIQNYEAGHVTRKWRVYSPYENGKADVSTHVEANASAPARTAAVPDVQTGLTADPVKARPGHVVSPTGSPVDPVTGSLRDPYKNKEINNYKNNFLSTHAEPIQRYFSEPMPGRKRESEWQAYEELRADYSDADIADCLAALCGTQLPGGELCHSPMAYLAIAMKDVLARVQKPRIAEAAREEASRQAAEEGRRRAEEDEGVRLECEIRDQAFERFLSGRNEIEVIVEICRRHDFPMPKGQIGRTFAISRWWDELSTEERKLAELSFEARHRVS